MQLIFPHQTVGKLVIDEYHTTQFENQMCGVYRWYGVKYDAFRCYGLSESARDKFEYDHFSIVRP